MEAYAFPDWAHLPLVVVDLISEKFKCINDYVNFRAVCSPWRYASLPKPHHLLPHQLPWLMIQPAPSIIRRTDDDGTRLFYDLWESKIRKIHLPETIDKKCCASYRGWLLLVANDHTEHFLLNPLTRTRVELPPLYINFSNITKMSFSTDLTDSNCLIMVFHSYSKGAYFCKVGDRCWTNAAGHPVWRGPDSLQGERLSLIDATYNNGNLYLLNSQAIFIYDPNQQRLQARYFFKPELHLVTKYFLEGKSGLYIVAVYYTEVVEGDRGQKFELYEVQEHPMELKQIADTREITIFVGNKKQYLAVRTDDWDSLDGDCMYMTLVWEPCRPYAGNEKRLSDIIFCAKLDDGKPKPLVLGLRDDLPIWLPTPPMWFQPSFV
ncbi:F-box protein SKIP23 [Carex littledalei]|uniref:F-box protein SKIP23 n=1 Tax=Carex littledalei TaxID=544730 RepID=A0A833RRR4_9POAL|nr:F-box protein SKIP23 [Carex littledalei]